MTKAISLLSGGLDSILATRLIMEQGIEVQGLNFMTVFCNCTQKNSSCQAGSAAAKTLGIPLKIMEVSQEYFSVIKNPKHGYGRNLNPCLDCRIFMFKKAGAYMQECGASFIVTGEVLGERPMSQRSDAMRIIEKESGLEGMIVRPLCAGLMKPSRAEEQGLVDRNKFLSISGRSRKPQIQLARDFGINDYPCPAGGCLLTDKEFANRMRDLMKHEPDLPLVSVRLLRCGRHFRLSSQAKLIVGRDEKENSRLEALAGEGDIIFQTPAVAGPLAVGRGIFANGHIETAARIVGRYSDAGENQPLEVSYCRKAEQAPRTVSVAAFSKEEADRFRI